MQYITLLFVNHPFYEPISLPKFSIVHSIHSHPTHKMLTALTLELFDNTTLSNTNTLSNTKQISDQSMYFINLNNVLSPKKVYNSEKND